TREYTGCSRAGKPGSERDASASGAEEIGELGGDGLVELVVGTRARFPVGAPPHEAGGVPEAAALVAGRPADPLDVLEGNLGHELESHRVPGEVLAASPARLTSRHSVRGLLGLGPFPPGMVLERVRAE